jgi:CheY-like chemotaxis protein
MSRQLAILLVEDDENDVFFLKRAFEEAQIDNAVQVARDGQEAIDYLSGTKDFANRSRYPLPCLIILDLKMPNKTGLEVLDWLRQQPVLRCIPVILFSSSAHRNDVERAYRFGANAFVVKPPSTEDRTDLARFIKGFWLRFNEPPMMCTEGLEAAQRFHASASEGGGQAIGVAS